jgi:outer membrane protein assembly complex protein YaeT
VTGLPFDCLDIMRAKGFLLMIVLQWLLLPGPSHAIQLDNLDSTRAWRVRDIEFSGNQRLSEGDLESAVLTRPRPWYRFWEERPVFDPITFREDLQRLKRLYESRGFYHAEIKHDLLADEENGWVAAKIEVVEGPPIVTTDVAVEVVNNPNLPERLPLKTGDVFTEEAYQKSEQALQQFYGERGFAYVESQRKAEVILDENSARVEYNVTPGPPSVFGPSNVQGLSQVEPEIVLRERTYKEGEAYSLKKIAETRSKLVALDLFGTVNVAPEKTPDKPPVVPMSIQVTEKEPRELRWSVGYGTEDRFRTQLEWRHNNWLGDGRRLSILAKYSSLETTGALTFIQPHLFSPRARGVVVLRHNREDEDTYLLHATRFNPRLEYRFSDQLTGFLGYRLEHDRFEEVKQATVRAIGAVDRTGRVSGPGLGLTWTNVDSVLDPNRGEILSMAFDHSGQPWGGDYRFYRITGEARKYWSIGWQTTLATRLKLGFADPLGSVQNLPLSDRFYAGGEKSVRGFGRRRLGPLSAADDPIGGLSLLEGSMELRRPIWQQLIGAVFVDFGQVSARRFHVPVRDLKFSSGIALGYQTPVGPVRVDIGFPFDPPRGDRPFQVHFSVGAYF